MSSARPDLLPRPEPLYFGPAAAPSLAWFHASGDKTAPMAVLLCNTWGDEELGAHRSLYELACRLAQSGLPVLRFDLAGEGEAFDPLAAPGSDRWPLWLASVQAALDLLKRRSGAPALALLGLRLGALLAAHAATGRDDVAALVALLPPASGRAWLREMRLMDQRAGPPGGGDGSLAAGGFVLEPATAASLAALAVPHGAPVSVPRLLLLDRGDLPLPDGALQPWRGLAAVFEHDRRSDLGELLAIAHSARLPDTASQALVAWLQARAAESAAPAEPAEGMASQPGFAGVWPGAAGVAAQGVHESVEWVCGRLVGSMARPQGAPRDGAPGLLLLSSGAERRIGPHRLWVAFARERARGGEVVLRLDLAGLGDSPARPGEPRAEIYDARAAEDVAAAVAWLQREHAVGAVSVVGICSGAYHAWHGALAGAPVQAVVAINPLVFHWRPGMSLDPAAHAFGQIAIAAQAARAGRDPRRWLKLLRGRVNVRVILAALAAQAAAALRRRLRGLAGAVGGRAPRWLASGPGGQHLGEQMQFVVQRGVVAHFLFSEGEPGRTLLAHEAGTALCRLVRDGHVQLATVEQADHTFTQQAARQRLYNQLNPLLDAASRRRMTPLQLGAALRSASPQRPTFS